MAAPARRRSSTASATSAASSPATASRVSASRSDGAVPSSCSLPSRRSRASRLLPYGVERPVASMPRAWCPSGRTLRDRLPRAGSIHGRARPRQLRSYAVVVAVARVRRHVRVELDQRATAEWAVGLPLQHAEHVTLGALVLLPLSVELAEPAHRGDDRVRRRRDGALVGLDRVVLLPGGEIELAHVVVGDGHAL